MPIACVIGVAAGVATIILLFASPGARRFLRRVGAAVIDVERRYHVLSMGLTVVVLMAALCAAVLALLMLAWRIFAGGWG